MSPPRRFGGNGEDPRDDPVDRFLDVDGSLAEFEVVREAGDTTFSAAAMDRLIISVGLWITSRLMRSWQATGRPPTRLRITVDVEVVEE